MKTLSYVNGTEEEIQVGKSYYFGQIWDGNGDGIEILQSLSICIGQDENDMPVLIDFTILEENENLLETVVKLNSIY